MQQDTSNILYYLFQMTFNLKGSVDHEFSFIVKIKRNTIVINSNKIHIFYFSSITRLKQDATRHI
jgi:hypothetical protein